MLCLCFASFCFAFNLQSSFALNLQSSLATCHHSCFCWQVCKHVATLTNMHDYFVSLSQGAVDIFNKCLRLLRVLTTCCNTLKWVFESYTALWSFDQCCVTLRHHMVYYAQLVVLGYACHVALRMLKYCYFYLFHSAKYPFLDMQVNNCEVGDPNKPLSFGDFVEVVPNESAQPYGHHPVHSDCGSFLHPKPQMGGPKHRPPVEQQRQQLNSMYRLHTDIQHSPTETWRVSSTELTTPPQRRGSEARRPVSSS